MGPELLSRILGLTEVQEGVLNIIFRIADDNGLLLIDLKDLKAMINYVGEHKDEYTLTYGNIATQSLGAITRALIPLENQGGDMFFGEPMMDIMDWIRVDNNGKVTAVSGGSADIYAMSCNRTATCTVTVQPDASLTYAGESEYDKCMRLFGCYLTERERDVYYLGTGGRHVTSVQVPVWRIDSSGNKYGSSLYLNVHINLAATVKAIFTDIYNGPEKFPIYSAGGYRDERGEHGAGMAIDINAYENGEFVFSGGTLVPTANWFWAPGENPYSIPPNGDVVKAFKKYGWGWGGEWRSKRDYMHFSYFHT